jgi:hypothetical protein
MISRRALGGLAAGILMSKAGENQAAKRLNNLLTRPSQSTGDEDPLQVLIDATPDGGYLSLKESQTFYTTGLEVKKSIKIDFGRSSIIATNPLKDLLRCKGQMKELPAVTFISQSGNRSLLILFEEPPVLQIGDWVKVVAEDLEAQVGHHFYVRFGRTVQIRAIRGNKVLTSGIEEGALPASQVRAYQFARMCVQLSGGTFVGLQNAEAVELPSSHLIVFEGLQAPSIEKAIITGGPQPGVVFRSCVGGLALSCKALNLGDRLGVGFASLNSTETNIKACTSFVSRHLADSNANSVQAGGDPLSYGIDNKLLVEDCQSKSATTSALTTHGPSFGAQWRNIRVQGANKVIGARGRFSRYDTIEAKHCDLGIQVVTSAEGLEVLNSKLYLNGQILISDSGDGRNQGLLGRNSIKDSKIVFYCHGYDAAMVPIISSGGKLTFENVTFEYLGSKQIVFLDLYGLGFVEFVRCQFIAKNALSAVALLSPRTKKAGNVSLTNNTFVNVTM